MIEDLKNETAANPTGQPPEPAGPAINGAGAATALAEPEADVDSGLAIWQVPLSEIDAEGSPFRFRLALKPDAKIKELAASIEAEGLLHPLTVRRVGEKFQLISGFRRHTALTYLARTQGKDPASVRVKVSVLPEGTSDAEALKISFAENLSRKSLDGTEKAIAVLKLRDEFGKSMEEIGDLVHLGRSQLNKLTNLLAAPEDVRTSFRDGKYGLKQALALAKVSNAATREMLIRRAGVKRLRLDAIATAAHPGGPGTDGEDPSQGLPERVREFVRVSRTENADRPIRVTVLLKAEEALQRLVKYLARTG